MKAGIVLRAGSCLEAAGTLRRSTTTGNIQVRGNYSGIGCSRLESHSQLAWSLNASATRAKSSCRSSGEGGGGGDGGGGNISSAPRRPSILLGSHVREALANGEPIVALESTVITHGLPEPQNLELALGLEREIARFCLVGSANGDNFGRGRGASGERAAEEQPQSALNIEAGALTDAAAATEGPDCPSEAKRQIVTPATVGVVKGQLTVGLSVGEIEYLAAKERSKPIKASRRDVPITMALGLSAGTTVSATMAIASSLRWQRADWTLSPDCNHRVKVPFAGGSPIKVFATGGTGGVHLGGESSLDISADLYEFARSPMGVVSSGFKSFLDTRRSLEFLETFGCTVASLRAEQQEGQADDLFPGFFTSANRQGVRSPCVLRDVEQAAHLLFHCLEAPLATHRALLLAVPIPRQFSLDHLNYDEALHKVASIDERTDLAGKDKTPLILEQLNKATGGESLRANMELLMNNARVGAHLALEYALLRERTGSVLGYAFARGLEARRIREDSAQTRPATSTSIEAPGTAGLEARSFVRESGTGLTAPKPREEHNEGDERADEGSAGRGPVVVGCTMIDMHVSTKIDDHFKANSSLSGITFEGQPHLTLGGVGRNLATALEFLNHVPVFITSLAKDNLASFALLELEKTGFKGRLEVATRPDSESSCFALVLIDSIVGQCEYVIANLDAMKAIDVATIETNSEIIRKSPLVVLDANLTSDTIEHLIKLCHRLNVPIFLEPTDKLALPRLVGCLQRLRQNDADCLSSLLCLSPNLIEFMEILKLFDGEPLEGIVTSEKSFNLEELECGVKRLMQTHLPELKCLLVTMDKRGVFVAVKSKQNVEDVVLIKDHKESISRGGLPLRMKNFKPPVIVDRPISASGAGDSFAAGFISGILKESKIDECLATGFQASQFALHDHDTISTKLRDLLSCVNRQSGP